MRGGSREKKGLVKSGREKRIIVRSEARSALIREEGKEGMDTAR